MSSHVLSLQVNDKYYHKVISSLFSKTLSGITGGKLPSLANEEAVNMEVVNLFYPKPNLNAPHNGFGYLIPAGVDWQSVNPHGALGVIFDSDRDALAPPDVDANGQPTAPQTPGTKLTVMLGGHHWKDLDPNNKQQWPSSSDAIMMAKSLVNTHLGISFDEPVFASSKTAKNCIPQHYVGHRDSTLR